MFAATVLDNVAVGLGLAILAAGTAVGLAVRVTTARREIEISRRQLELEMRRLEMDAEAGRFGRRPGSFESDYDLTGSVSQQTLRQMIESIEAINFRIRALDARLPTEFDEALQRFDASRVLGRPFSQRADPDVVTELAHGLKTPLAHLESVLTSAADGHLTPEERTEMLESIDLCKATIAGFREVSRVAAGAEGWTADLKQGVEALHRLHATSCMKSPSLSHNLPSSIDSYSTNYVLAMLTPLIENAIEASPLDGLIRILFTDGDSEILISVTNETTDSVDEEMVFGEGRSTKPGHEGRGVSIARHLAEASGGTLSMDASSGLMTMTLRLPSTDG
jgi:signal transduction histidine kinase